MATVNKYCLMLNEERAEYLASNGYSRTKRVTLTDPKAIVDYMNQTYAADRLPMENLWLLCFDNKGSLTGCFELSRGTVNLSYIDPREIFKAALMASAVKIVLVHNHPSGNSDPSSADVRSTGKIEEGGKLLNVPLADHIIIGDNRYFSFFEHQLVGRERSEK